ncbi:hypothetical protein Q4602_11205 [Paraglaciecola chathamensis]|uniref:hypothetical protein n=1 Tax=Paraglaciecola chathamensis TaxID=368405 RepID=UPI0026FE7269|nr:hypothetical protein [Paraglaciecola chathamensis]MDO6840037.1 hypothetical protein [Paraglaciecola chathamensis]
MKVDFSPSLPPRPKPKTGTLWIILASVLLHLGILFLVAQTPHEIPNFDTSKDGEAKIKPITARLIFPPIEVPAEVESTPVDSPEPMDSLEPTDSPAITAPAPVSEPKATAQLEEPPAVKQTPDPVVAPVPEPEAVAETVPEPSKTEVAQPKTESEASFMQQDPLAPPESSKKPTLAEGQEQTVADKVKGQLHNSTQQSIAELAAEEAARYRREQTSPSLLDKPELSQLTEDEKLEKENEILADCSSYTNKGVAILAGLTGGNIKCTTTNGAESFIQDRLNKSAHLPAMKDKKDK